MNRSLCTFLGTSCMHPEKKTLPNLRPAFTKTPASPPPTLTVQAVSFDKQMLIAITDNYHWTVGYIYFNFGRPGQMWYGSPHPNSI